MTGGKGVVGKLLVARFGAWLRVMHNTLRRLKLDPPNFAEEERSRRRQAWTEGWEADRQAGPGIL
jgi:hypothetical protein